MIKKDTKMKKAFLQSILSSFSKTTKPDFIKTYVKNNAKTVKGKNVIQKK